MGNLTDRLREKEHNQGQGKSRIWRPEPGEILEGTVSKIGTTVTEWGDVDYAEIETENGTVRVYMNTVLLRLMVEENVKEGDAIAVKFLGMKKCKKGRREYKDFILVKDAETAEPESADEPF